MKTVSLVNRRRAILPPIHVPALGLDEHIIGTNDRDMKTGAVGRRKVAQKLPRAVTLCARGTSGDRVDGLPESAAADPEVVDAKKRGDIDVIVSVVPAAVLRAPEPPPGLEYAPADSSEKE